jgi:DNA-binding MarR family transcriptional regulator
MVQSVFDPSRHDFDIESKIVFALERLADTFRVLLWNENTRFRLSPLQLQFIIFLHYHGAKFRTITGLAREFNLSKATVSDSVKSLERKGLLNRERSASDRRISVLTLTKGGKQTAAAVANFGESIRLPVSQLSEYQKTDFFKLLMLLLSEFHQSNIISPLRMCVLCKNLRFESHNGSKYYCSNRNKYLQDRDFRIDCDNYVYSTNQDENFFQFFP